MRPWCHHRMPVQPGAACATAKATCRRTCAIACLCTGAWKPSCPTQSCTGMVSRQSAALQIVPSHADQVARARGTGCLQSAALPHRDCTAAAGMHRDLEARLLLEAAPAQRSGCSVACLWLRSHRNGREQQPIHPERVVSRQHVRLMQERSAIIYVGPVRWTAATRSIQRYTSSWASFGTVWVVFASAEQMHQACAGSMTAVYCEGGPIGGIVAHATRILSEIQCM